MQYQEPGEKNDIEKNEMMHMTSDKKKIRKEECFQNTESDRERRSK